VDLPGRTWTGHIQVWSVKGAELVAQLDDIPEYVDKIQIDATGESLLYAGYSKDLFRWS